LNLAAAFAAGVFVGEWTRQSKVNRRRRRQDRLLCGVSSLASPGRHVVVVTTAALPWRTGTAVNPALRAAHLAAAGLRVTLLVPWLPPSEQPQVYPPGQVFQTPEEQAEHLVADAQRRAGFAPGGSEARFRVAWYRARYFPSVGSILPIDDVTEAVPAEDAAAGCAVVLEEPEHLTWFAHRTRWTSRFPHVVGVMHTNYLSYVAQGLNGGAGGAVAASALYRINKWTCRLHCHKVIKLSDAVQRLPRQVTCNVHGVASCFLEQGRKVALAAAAARRAGGEDGAADGLAEGAGAAAGGAHHQAQDPSTTFSKGAYFIGKAVWGKGWRELLELLDYAQQKREQQQEQQDGGDGDANANDAPATTPTDPKNDIVDLYGGGEDLDAIEREASARDLRVSFKGPADHSDAQLIGPYRVFLNPSTSDVVATTTAEALAMGKWVVCAHHPSNAFFSRWG
jgi:digalactosyldiacylglycerol synthase